MSKNKFNEIRLAETYRVNAFKAGISEDSIVIDHGQIESENDVKIVSSIAIPPDLLGEYLTKIIVTAIAYQDKYNVDLGFSKELIEDDEKVVNKDGINGE